MLVVSQGLIWIFMVNCNVQGWTELNLAELKWAAVPNWQIVKVYIVDNQNMFKFFVSFD